jgi:hypothetical protein
MNMIIPRLGLEPPGGTGGWEERLRNDVIQKNGKFMKRKKYFLFILKRR